MKMKLYSKGIIFYRKYKTSDIALIIGTVLFFCIFAGIQLQSLEWVGVSAFLAILVNIYFFRPVYGYINIEKGYAMSRCFQRRQLKTLRMEFSEQKLKIITRHGYAVFFEVPNVSEAQYEEIKKYALVI